MLTLVIKRAALGLMTLWAASVLIFAGTQILPGDLAQAVLQNNATAENVAALRHDLGLDRPAVERYADWLGKAVRGDFGTSLINKRDVSSDLAPRLYNTLFLALYAAAIAVPLSVALGILTAAWQGSIFDAVANAVTLLAISLPEYFLGYLLIKWVAVYWGLFPVLASVTPETSFSGRLYMAFLPMLTLVLVIVAHMMRMTRASVIAVMSSPYIEMALLKGLPKWRVVVEHALPNALAPIINVVALNLAYLIVGVVVIEVVFVYPGLGQSMVDAVAKRDVPVVQACGLIFATVFITLNMVADILALVSNPRLRHPR
ncbi:MULTISPECIES: ABC transporter permease [unclassified Rhizobium]|uniref:ABC transporter permease n=1 Tax=unclassified Rhizobium TaxID=2613769 RepID=UPI00064881D1|nr:MULTISPECIES: ABC transporter permease [unclassified Rhizobium]RKD35801.1 peptide/nickel transport system permease protein [Rhizobium sp. WW_1]